MSKNLKKNLIQLLAIKDQKICLEIIQNLIKLYTMLLIG